MLGGLAYVVTYETPLDVEVLEHERIEKRPAIAWEIRSRVEEVGEALLDSLVF